jgi:Protein of unknown function (DUF3551)
MRTALILATALMLLFQVGAANAQNYPWCAQYGSDNGGRNCGFVNYEQCRAAISGNGGYCIENLMYQPEPASRRVPRRPRY